MENSINFNEFNLFKRKTHTQHTHTKLIDIYINKNAMEGIIIYIQCITRRRP